MPIANDNTLSSILDLYTKARGTTTTSSSGSNISKEGVDGLIQQILSSSQGLAQVSSGQKSSGLYNSSANSMLTNDLISSAAGKVAALQAGTTTTSRTGGVSGSDAKTGLLLAAGKSILGPSITGAAKKAGFNTTKPIGDQVADMLGLGSGGGSGGANSGVEQFNNFDIGDQLTDSSNASAGVDLFNNFDVGDQLSNSTTDIAADEGGDFLGSLFA